MSGKVIYQVIMTIQSRGKLLLQRSYGIGDFSGFLGIFWYNLGFLGYCGIFWIFS